MDTEGNVLSLHQTVVPFGKLVFEHGNILPADAVKGILLLWDIDCLLVFLHIDHLIYKGKLHPNGGIEIVEEVAVVFKNQRLVLILCQLIVDIEKFQRLGEEVFVQPTDSIRIDFLIGNGLLCGGRDFLSGKKLSCSCKEGCITVLPFF